MREEILALVIKSGKPKVQFRDVKGSGRLLLFQYTEEPIAIS